MLPVIPSDFISGGNAKPGWPTWMCTSASRFHRGQLGGNWGATFRNFLVKMGGYFDKCRVFIPQPQVHGRVRQGQPRPKIKGPLFNPTLALPVLLLGLAQREIWPAHCVAGFANKLRLAAPAAGLVYRGPAGVIAGDIRSQVNGIVQRSHGLFKASISKVLRALVCNHSGAKVIDALCPGQHPNCNHQANSPDPNQDRPFL